MFRYRIMKWKTIVISIFILILSWNAHADLNHSRVYFKDHCFYVELAQTADEKTRGLMFREHLNPDRGMFFIFEDEGEYSFWMKNTLIPLDIIWINKNKEAVFISRDTQPCKTEPCPTINPGIKAKYVLELNGGTAEKIGLTVGDRLEFDID